MNRMGRMGRVLALALLATACAGCETSESEVPERVVFAVVLSRHGVRSPTKAPPDTYVWPSWEPTAFGDLTAHGFALATFMGRYELDYFRRRGLLLGCGAGRVFAWADFADQRTMETARGLLQTLSNPAECLAAPLSLAHTARGQNALFDPLPAVGGSSLEYTAASQALSVRAAMYSDDGSLAGIVGRHASEFSAFQDLLDGRCAQPPCAPFVDKPASIEPKHPAALPHSLAKLTGPVPFAATQSENLFLEYAQCRPLADILGTDTHGREALLRDGMRLHALGYDIDQRNSATSAAEGTNLLAHIVAMLDEKAGRPHPFAATPDLAGTEVALLLGHDTNISAIAGLMDANWSFDGAFQANDTPPLGALAFELHRDAAGAYGVRLRFLAQLPAQMRADRPISGGAGSYPVQVGGCTAGDCALSLEELETIVSPSTRGAFIEAAWPASDPTTPTYPPLTDPPWTACE